MLPPVIVMSSTVKPVTSSEKLNEKETSPVAVPLVSSLITTVGLSVSNAWVAWVAAALLLPAASRAAAAGTSTVMVPELLASGVTIRL